MINLVFCLEEPSAREMLKGLLPRVLPDDVFVHYLVFQGKQDLERRLEFRVKHWNTPDSKFIVMRDQDGGDAPKIKAGLVKKCQDAGQPEALVRIACRELESFYLGDLAAVERAIGPANISRQQNKAKFRAPDNLGNPSEELKKIAPLYQKLDGSRRIGPELSLDNNRSNSFNVLVSGVKRIIAV